MDCYNIVISEVTCNVTSFHIFSVFEVCQIHTGNCCKENDSVLLLPYYLVIHL